MIGIKYNYMNIKELLVFCFLGIYNLGRLLERNYKILVNINLDEF